MKFLVPIAAMLGTALATLTAIVFCMGMGANATPAQIRGLKIWMAAFTLLGVAGIGAGIFLLRAGQHDWAAGAGIAPAVIMLVIFIIAVSK